MPKPFPVMQAIVTRYHGPTDFRGGRISASTASGLRVTIPYPHEANTEEAHRQAVDALCAKIGWEDARWVQGALKTGYAFVQVPE